jgi:threonine dehydrogenase-like Zn-dependent dehydrogenase
VPRLLSYVEHGELDPAILATHTMPLEQAPPGYDIFKNKADGCLRAVFTP